MSIHPNIHPSIHPGILVHYSQTLRDTVFIFGIHNSWTRTLFLTLACVMAGVDTTLQGAIFLTFSCSFAKLMVMALVHSFCRWISENLKWSIVTQVFGQTSLGKQCRPRSDQSRGAVWSGSSLFACFFGPLVYGKTISFRLNSNFLWCPVFTVYFLFKLICSVYHLLAGGGPVNAKPAPNAPQAIVIEPSRELAEQVSIPLPNTPPTVKGGPFNYQTSPLCATGHRIQPSRELAEQVSIPLLYSLFDSRRWSSEY